MMYGVFVMSSDFVIRVLFYTCKIAPMCLGGVSRWLLYVLFGLLLLSVLPSLCVLFMTKKLFYAYDNAWTLLISGLQDQWHLNHSYFKLFRAVFVYPAAKTTAKGMGEGAAGDEREKWEGGKTEKAGTLL